MFQGTRKEGFDSRINYNPRRFFNVGEVYERTEFGELDLRSGDSSPHGYGDFSIDRMCTQQEKQGPHQNPTKPRFRDRSSERNYHQAYNEKIEYPRERGEYRTRPGKTKQASPMGKIWTPNTLRGLKNRSPSPHKGGRYVLSPSEQLEEKEKEEHLSLRFAHMPMTKCPYYLHYHGFDYEHDPPVLDPSLLESIEPPEFNHPGDEWWKNPREEHSCRRCLSHHRKNQKREKRREKEGLNSERIYFLREGKDSRRRNATPGGSSTEFTTPREEFSRSRTPTPQRSSNYRDLYERKVQARRSPSKSPTCDLRQLWKPLEKTPKHNIEEYLSQCKVRKIERNYDDRTNVAPWTQHKFNERKKVSPGRFPQYHKSHNSKDAHLTGRIGSSIRSPNWSKECLHKRELRSTTHRKAIDMVRAKEDRSAKQKINYIRQNILIGKKQRPTVHDGREISPKVVKGMLHRRNQELPINSKLEKESKRMLEERELHWASPPNWTTRQLNVKELKQRGASPMASPKKSPEKSFKINGELPPTKVQEMKENLKMNTWMNVGDGLRINISSRSSQPFPSKMHSNEKSSAEKMGQGPIPQQDHYRFELINMETKKLKERNENSRENSSKPNSSPNHKQIYLRIPKSRGNTKNDNDQNAAPHGANSQATEKSPHSKHRGDKDIKLTIGIKSELPLDAVDGRLKEFLKGVGGLIYHSPKDGGIPRIKELTNYFSGKQPLLWFFPRST